MAVNAAGFPTGAALSDFTSDTDDNILFDGVAFSGTSASFASGMITSSQASGVSFSIADATSAGTLGPSVALTVFDSGARSAVDRIAIDNFNQASENYKSTAVTAFHQVQDNLVLANRLAQEASQEQQAVQTADHTASLLLSLFNLGAVTYLDVVTAQTADLDAQRTALSIATRRLHASVDVVRALGGGWR